MSTRFLTNGVLALAGGFVVVASKAFAPAPTAWLAFALGILIIIVAALGQLDRSRGDVQRILDGATMGLGVITIVFSLVFHGGTVAWLSFAEALGVVALAATGLTLNEIAQWRTERGLASLHYLRVMDMDRAQQQRVAS
jgi:cation transport ATPase